MPEIRHGSEPYSLDRDRLIRVSENVRAIIEEMAKPARLVLYGFGACGQLIFDQLSRVEGVHFVAIVDRTSGGRAAAGRALGPTPSRRPPTATPHAACDVPVQPTLEDVPEHDIVLVATSPVHHAAMGRTLEQWAPSSSVVYAFSSALLPECVDSPPDHRDATVADALAVETRLWRHHAACDPPARDSAYHGCRWIEAGIALSGGHITVCRQPTRAAGGIPPIASEAGAAAVRIPVSTALHKRRDMIRDSQRGRLGRCEGCLHLSWRRWPARPWMYQDVCIEFRGQRGELTAAADAILSLASKSLLSPRATIHWLGLDPASSNEFDAAFERLHFESPALYSVTTDASRFSPTLDHALGERAGSLCVRLPMDGDRARPARRAVDSSPSACWRNLGRYVEAGGSKVEAELVLRDESAGEIESTLEHLIDTGVRRLRWDIDPDARSMPERAIESIARLKLRCAALGLECIASGFGTAAHPELDVESRVERAVADALRDRSVAEPVLARAGKAARQEPRGWQRVGARARVALPAADTAEVDASALDALASFNACVRLLGSELERGNTQGAARVLCSAVPVLLGGSMAFFRDTRRARMHGSERDLCAEFDLLCHLFESLETAVSPAALLSLAAMSHGLAPESQSVWLLLARTQLELGLLDEAIEELRRIQRARSPFIIAERYLEQAYRSVSGGRQRAAADGFGLGDLGDRFCPVPFETMNLAEQGEVWTCCPSYLPTPIGSYYEKSAAKIWNSDVARELRRSILDGDFSHCSRIHCPRIVADDLPRRDEVLDPLLRGYIDERRTEIAEPPREIYLSHDPTCNLSCQQCRGGLKVASAEESRYFSDFAERFIFPMLEAQPAIPRRVVVSGNGDPFVSKHYRHILSLLDPQKHRQLRLRIMTNGLRLADAWQRFPNIHPLTKEISISIDAATAGTYAELRGGDWSKLMRGLKLAAEIRGRGEIESLILNFAVQRGNYREMVEFVQLAARHRADHVSFVHLRNHGTYAEGDYARRAVFDPAHPEHASFLAELGRPELSSDKVDLGALQGLQKQLPPTPRPDALRRAASSVRP